MVTQSNIAAKDAGALKLVPALDRAIRVLGILEAAPQTPFTVAEIAKSLSMPKSTTFNICNALVEAEFLRRMDRGFQLGRRLVQLGSAYGASVDLVREFYEVCRIAPVDLSACIQLSVLDDGLNAMYLAFQDCNSGLRLGLGGAIGRMVPANCSASGKAMLAALPPQALKERLDRVSSLPGLTPASITSFAQLKKALAKIRADGISAEEGEVVADLTCIARTVNVERKPEELVAVSITASKKVATKERRARFRDVLRQVVERLEARL